MTVTAWFGGHRVQLVLVLLVCLAVRLACLRFYGIDPAVDVVNPDDWDAVATNLVRGRGYTLYAPQAGVYDWDLTHSAWAYRPTMRVPPIYPLVLAALYGVVGVDHRAGLLAQVCFDVLTGWVVYRIGTRLFDRRAGLLAALGWGGYLPEVTSVLRLRSEPLFTLLLCVCVWSFLAAIRRPSSPRFALTGALIGLAALCRPSMVGVAALFLLYVAMRGRASLVPSLTVLAVLAPWMIRGVLLFGTVVPVATNGGYSLYRSIFTISRPDYLTGEPPDFVRAYATFTEALQRQPTLHVPKDEADLDRMFRNEAWQLIRAHPFRYLHVCADSLMRLWFRLYGGRLAGWKDTLTGVMNAGLLLLAGFGLRRGGIRQSIALAGLIVYNSLFYAMTLADPRYNLPIIPLVLILSARGVMNTSARWRV